MKLFTVYPHIAYTNTEVHFFSEIDCEINILNTRDGSNIYLSKDKSIHKRLAPGKHVFECEHNGIRQTEIVEIEDAIKLGGSTLKNFFVLEKSP